MRQPKKPRRSFSITDADTRYAQKQERKVAQDMGGKQQPNSGATPFLKGDFTLGDYVVDLKSTQGTVIAITVEMLKRAEQFGMRQFKSPLIILNFTKTKELRHKRWAVVPL
jgi:hypothetical protein